MANPEKYRIGELSKRTGLSAAALHHYEEMGLIAPGRDPESGYRMYGAEELLRLQEIAILKEMGFKLSDIARMAKTRTKAPALGSGKTHCEDRRS